jgi:6-phosphogluconolactonase (cycloisomerase 2 family)
VQSQGILTLAFNPSQPVDESIRILATNTDVGYLPGWITQYEDNFYSVSRTEYPTPSSVDGGVFAFHVKEGNDRHSQLDHLNSISSGGQGAVYVDVSRDGRTISVANMFVILESDGIQVRLTHIGVFIQRWVHRIYPSS